MKVQNQEIILPNINKEKNESLEFGNNKIFTL